MDFEETEDMYGLFMIDPMLVCSCDHLHICQVCNYIDEQEKKKQNERSRISSAHKNE